MCKKECSLKKPAKIVSTSATNSQQQTLLSYFFDRADNDDVDDDERLYCLEHKRHEVFDHFLTAERFAHYSFVNA